MLLLNCTIEFSQCPLAFMRLYELEDERGGVRRPVIVLCYHHHRAQLPVLLTHYHLVGREERDVVIHVINGDENCPCASLST